ncbi:bifunctional riboflavin kinase/FAD synthetase [Bacillus sp. FJAT-29937]|uniref:bifunctional riboflavin kinase/FAD synthetase n=1 Tax=Bacillus sp. FJAT-29937 TaxID=1720553 RepID=UPI0008354B5B|nr:bifunctional riboflavin kinase/FAD synthetase [Bacillus sp. FJAT-29937]
MEIILINHSQYVKRELPPLSIALGYFDGVHLGHQKVIKEAKSIAEENGFKSAVMTFDPHPSVVLGKSVKHVEYITPLREKVDLIEKLGIDYLFIVNFSMEFASLLPQEFVDQYLIGLNVKHVIAGFDYTYGRMGKGTMETLPFHSREKFAFTVVPKLVSNNEKISSTLIRSMIRDGRMEEFTPILGRYYSTNGNVIHGDKRGRTIGFPTANIELTDDYIFPPTGVYCVRINVHGEWNEGVCNVGYKPTFNKEMSKKPSIEVHIFDFNQDIYGQEVKVEWHLHLRKEQKFNGIEELVAQIEKDKRSALAFFEKNNV